MFGEADNRYVSVTGRGFVRVQPDTMNLTLSLEEIGATRQEAADKLSEKSQALMKALKALKIDKLELKSNVSVQPNYEWNNRTNKQEITGYLGKFQVSANEKGQKSEHFPDHASQIIEVATTSDANVNGPSYGLSEAVQLEASRDALSVAYDDAVKQAKRVAATGAFEISLTPDAVDIGHAPTNQNLYGGGRNMKAAAMAMESMDSAGGGGFDSEVFGMPTITVNSPDVTIRFPITAAAPAEASANKLDKQG